MPWATFDILLALPAFALILFRVSGLLLTAPIFASRVIPVRLRAALAFLIAAIMFPLVGGQAPSDLTLAAAVVGGVGELMIGVTIGLALSLMMMGAEVGGLIIGRQAGIALANVFDPTRNQQVTILGQLYTISLVLVFLLVGGHRATIAALLDTFEVIPILSFTIDDSLVVLLTEVMTSAFILGIRLALPALIALFLVTTALGFLSRTMPQLNILSVGFTVRALIAIAVAGLALAASEELLLNAIIDALQAVRTTFGVDAGSLRLMR